MIDELQNEFQEEIRHYEILQKQRIPKNTLDSLKLYVSNGVKPGGFLTAVLENNFMGAFSQADTFNAANMHAIAKYLYNEMPMNSFGSPEKVKSWLENFNNKEES